MTTTVNDPELTTTSTTLPETTNENVDNNSSGSGRSHHYNITGTVITIILLAINFS
jgi:hypothetical protein